MKEEQRSSRSLSLLAHPNLLQKDVRIQTPCASHEPDFRKLRRATRFVFAFSSISTTHSRSSWGFCKLLYCCGGILKSKKGRLRNCSLGEILVVVAQRRDITIFCFQSVLITSSKFCRRIHPKVYMRTRFAIITTASDSSTQDCRLYLSQTEVSLLSCILCDQLTTS